jgi:DNA-binding PadR family transcriptional regulator
MALRHALLGLLARGPASGWDLQQSFDSSLAQVWPASHSQVYSELNKLAGEGLVSVASEGPRRRKEYTLARAGRLEWLRWMAEESNAQPRRSEMLLRVFFLDLIPADGAAELLRSVGSEARSYEDQLRALAPRLAADVGPMSTNGVLALEYGIRLARLQQEWAKWASDRVQEAPDKPA